MLLIGLTGGIASGKSTVSKMLRARGFPVLDADATYHALLQPTGGVPSPLARDIAAHFAGVMGADGSIDRKALAARVFAHPEERATLEMLTHPEIAKEIHRQIEELRGQHRVVFYDVPLLFEKRLQSGFDGVLLVWVPSDVQVTRLQRRDAIDETAARTKIAAQMPLDQKHALATWVVDNSGSEKETETQLQDVLNKI